MDHKPSDHAESDKRDSLVSRLFSRQASTKAEPRAVAEVFVAPIDPSGRYRRASDLSGSHDSKSISASARPKPVKETNRPSIRNSQASARDSRGSYDDVKVRESSRFSKDEDKALREAKEKAAKEAKDKELKEKEAKEKEAKEAKDKEAKEKAAKEKDAKEKAAKEKEAKEKEAKEKAAKEKDAKEKDAKDKDKDVKDVKTNRESKDKPTPVPSTHHFLGHVGKAGRKAGAINANLTAKTKKKIEEDRLMGRMTWEADTTKIGKDGIVTNLYSRRSFIDLKHCEPPAVLREGQRTDGLKIEGSELKLEETCYYRIRANLNADWKGSVMELLKDSMFHFYRSVRASSLRSNIASPEERVYLMTQHQEISTVMMNLFAWRRSALLCVVILSIIQIAFAALSVSSTITTVFLVKELAHYNSSVFRINLFNETELDYVSPQVMDHFNLPDPRTFSKTAEAGLEPFAEYSARAVQVGLQRMLIDTTIAQAALECVTLLIVISISATALIGLLYWSSYDQSRSAVKFGWMLAVFGPFFISMLPTQYLVRWNAIDDVIDDYEVELAVAYGHSNITNFAETSKLLVEGFIGISFAFNSFRILVPAALSIAPALIRGAMKVKSVIPQANLPGTFILLVPWLYCPLAWSIMNLCAQMLARVCSPFVFVGFLVLALKLMPYSFVGARMQVTSALTDEKVDEILATIQRFAKYGSWLGLALLFLSAFWIPDSQLVEFARELLDILAIVRLVVATTVQWLFTAVAGVDFMVWQLARDRNHELTLTRNPDGTKAFFSEKGRTEMIEELVRHRVFRLDEFVRFSGLATTTENDM